MIGHKKSLGQMNESELRAFVATYSSDAFAECVALTQSVVDAVNEKHQEFIDAGLQYEKTAAEQHYELELKVLLEEQQRRQAA